MGVIYCSTNPDEREQDSWLHRRLSRFSGYLNCEKTFLLQYVPKKIILDLGEVKYMAEVYINGKNVGARLWPPYKYDISPYVKTGENNIKIKVGNLISNKMGVIADMNDLYI